MPQAKYVHLSTKESSLAQEEAFFRYLYHTSREHEVSQWGWSKEEQEAFLNMQFTLQTHSYTLQYPDLQVQTIYYKEEAIGRLLIRKGENEWRLVDVTLLPLHQNRGYGTELIRSLQQEASHKGRPLSLHVQRSNLRAFALYQELGFTVASSDELYTHMNWAADQEDKKLVNENGG